MCGICGALADSVGPNEEVEKVRAAVDRGRWRSGCVCVSVEQCELDGRRIVQWRPLARAPAQLRQRSRRSNAAANNNNNKLQSAALISSNESRLSFGHWTAPNGAAKWWWLIE